MNASSLKTRIFREGEALFPFFLEFAPKELPERTIIVVASKIVALSQRRTTKKSQESLESLVQREADMVIGEIPNSPFFLTEKNNILIANAGIDASNAEKDTYILWPEQVQKEVDDFLLKLKEVFQLTEAGVILSDSRVTPQRVGTTGVALAWSGFLGIRDERGSLDIYGNPLHYSQVAVADNLCAVAELMMGTAGESCPFAIITNFSAVFTENQQAPQMASIPAVEDLFSVAFRRES